jgi:hypothetical protein
VPLALRADQAISRQMVRRRACRLAGYRTEIDKDGWRQ